MSIDRNTARRQLGEAAIFSLNRAAELLPWADGEARQWLEARGLVRHVNGRGVVRWRDVLEALGGSPSAPIVKPTPKRAPLPRVKLQGGGA
jgi:hypothetical protein